MFGYDCADPAPADFTAIRQQTNSGMMCRSARLDRLDGFGSLAEFKKPLIEPGILDAELGLAVCA